MIKRFRKQNLWYGLTQAATLSFLCRILPTSLIASHLQTEHKIQYILSRPTKMPIQIEFLFTIIGSTLYIFEPSLCHKTALKFFLFCEQPSLNIKKTFSLPLFLSKIQLHTWDTAVTHAKGNLSWSWMNGTPTVKTDFIGMATHYTWSK